MTGQPDNIQQGTLPLEVVGAKQNTDTGLWEASDAGAYIQWPLQGVTGWLAISGQLQLVVGEAAFKLELHTASGSYPAALAVSLKGRIQDVLQLPEHVNYVRLYPLRSAGCFELSQLTLQPIHRLKAYWRMLRRVALFYWRQPEHVRLEAGLPWHLPLHHLPLAYQRVGLQRALSAPLSYPDWLKLAASRQSVARYQAAARQYCKRLRFTVVLYTQSECDRRSLQASVSSVERLIWPHAELTVLMVTDLGSKLPALQTSLSVQSVSWREALQMMRSERFESSDWVAFMRAGVLLSNDALCRLSVDISHQPDCLAWYSDHDHVTADGRHTTPCLKPDWSPHFQRVSHYAGDFCLVQSLALTVFEPMLALHGYELWLRVAEQVADALVGHSDFILWHQLDGSEPYRVDQRKLRESFQRQGLQAEIHVRDERFAAIHYALPEPAPLVSIIIPTRDMLHLVEACLTSLWQKTSYPNYEVLVIDNQSTDPAALQYFDRINRRERCRVIRYDHAFNYAAINNFAVDCAHGDFVCLLNNDTEIIEPDWLSRMLALLVQPGVGVVGAKLLYSHGTVQHAGDAVGPGGCADHMHSGIAGDAAGYMHRAILSQELSAVTAACLLTPRQLFVALGGLNAEQLAVAFNDVDYCLRVREAGYRVMLEADAVLYHHESVSRGKDDDPVKQQRASKEVAYMRERWADILQRDPYYNPNLNQMRPDFQLSKTPARRVV